MPSDIGLFVGRYLQVLGCLSIISIIINAILFDTFYVDLSFVLVFWAAPYLIRHNPTARNWTIGICGCFLIVMWVMLTYAAVAGTQNITVRFGKPIQHPQYWHVALIGVITAVLVGLPVVLLLTRQAREEFRHSVGT